MERAKKLICSASKDLVSFKPAHYEKNIKFNEMAHPKKKKRIFCAKAKTNELAVTPVKKFPRKTKSTRKNSLELCHPQRLENF
jgi:hypothetical protein